MVSATYKHHFFSTSFYFFSTFFYFYFYKFSVEIVKRPNCLGMKLLMVTIQCIFIYMYLFIYFFILPHYNNIYKYKKNRGNNGKEA